MGDVLTRRLRGAAGGPSVRRPLARLLLAAAVLAGLVGMHGLGSGHAAGTHLVAATVQQVDLGATADHGHEGGRHVALPSSLLRAALPHGPHDGMLGLCLAVLSAGLLLALALGLRRVTSRTPAAARPSRRVVRAPRAPPPGLVAPDPVALCVLRR